MGNLPTLAGLVGGAAGYGTQHTLGSVLLLCNYMSMGRGDQIDLTRCCQYKAGRHLGAYHTPQALKKYVPLPAGSWAILSRQQR